MVQPFRHPHPPPLRPSTPHELPLDSRHHLLARDRADLHLPGVATRGARHCRRTRGALVLADGLRYGHLAPRRNKEICGAELPAQLPCEDRVVISYQANLKGKEKEFVWPLSICLHTQCTFFNLAKDWRAFAAAARSVGDEAFHRNEEHRKIELQLPSGKQNHIMKENDENLSPTLRST